EPRDHVTATAVQYRGTEHPDDVAAATLLGLQQLRHAGVVDGLLAGDVRAHELELAARRASATEEARGVDVDAFAAVFRVSDGDGHAGLHVAAFQHHQ